MGGLQLSGGTMAVVALVAAVGYWLMNRQAPTSSPVTTPGQRLVDLVPRAVTLLKHVKLLNLPFLEPLLEAIAQSRFSAVPSLAHLALNQLDDDDQRRTILDKMFFADLERRTINPAKKEILVAALKRLGLSAADFPPAP